MFHLQAQEATQKDSLVLSEVIVSSQSMFSTLKNSIGLQGSKIEITEKELNDFHYSNTNRLLEGKAGVHLYEESGLGLRPNISIRGTAPERSSKINLMEDGIPIAPAPYSAPAAYYFPNLSRMQGIEIIKGSGQIKYGPNTAGGSLNLISKSIPRRLSTNANLSVGRFNSQEYRIDIGDKIGKIGYLVSYLGQKTKGFKHLPDGSNTGFLKNDWLGKLSYQEDIFGVPFEFLLKYQYANEEGNETYVGLLDADFQQDAFQRYQASSHDKMTNEHQQWAFSVQTTPFYNLSVSLDLYQNNFKRNWNKLQSIATDQGKISLGKMFTQADNYVNEWAVMKGNYTNEHDIYLRNNNRSYLSQGVQSRINYLWNRPHTKHTFNAGIRWHYDDMDRFQWEDSYRLIGNTIGLQRQGTPGSQSNFIDEAHAFSSFLQYQLQYEKLTLTSGLRYENIEFLRTDYGSDLSREGNDFEQRKNQNKVLIPGISLEYQWHTHGRIFVGAHKGFSPSGTLPNQQSEESWNYELGGQWNTPNFSIQSTVYYNAYDRLLGSDLQAAGGEGENDLLNAGSVNVSGWEISIEKNWRLKQEINIPFRLEYTYQNSEFSKDFDSQLYGEVTQGDHLPNIPMNQWKAELGIEKNKWKALFSIRHIGDRRTEVGQGKIPEQSKIKAYTICDLSLQFQLKKQILLFSTIENIGNETYAVSRLPYGLRPGMPIFAKLGMAVTL